MIDLDALVIAPCHATFGETVRYYPGTGPALDLLGVFEDKFVEATFAESAEVDVTRTVVNVRAALFPADPVKGELFRIRGVLYVINGSQPDGMGDIRFYLGLASDAEARRIPLPAA